ncbi:MAG: 8-amino-7-oxononanoate synthase [Gammaproteobacteria bacterium]|nr:8-amino-7-oxononanoate synthase [Gammaproteobacteria bacterium]
MKDLNINLRERKQADLYRQRHVQDGMQGAHVIRDGKKCLAFCSNDYLGLSHHPDVIKAMQQGAETYGVGSGAAHLINGHSRAHHALEEELAEFVQRPRALLFSTGYMANLGVMSSLMQRGDAVFEDRLNHASLIDAGLLSGARLQRYQHNDVSDLEKKLTKSKSNDRLIATDAVFSMDGDLAPVKKLAVLANQHDAWMMVDDAHGFGVLGENGRGTLEKLALGAEDVPVLMATLGKALGTSGAFIAGSDDLIETLINKARAYIYTTASPPAVAEACRESLRRVQQESWRREKLKELIASFRAGAEQLGLQLMDSETAIQPIMIGDNERAIKISDALWKKDIVIPAIRPPTVPEGTARLRVTFNADHEREHVEFLLDALEQAAL